jgi:tetratricopeptide (TPR) repeat protein
MSRTFHRYLLTTLIFVVPSLLFGQQYQESYQKDFQEALNLFDKGLYEASIPLFETAKSSAENSATRETASFLHARAFIKIDSSGVERHVDQFVQTYPMSTRSAVLLKELGHLHKENGDLEEAISNLDAALNYPQSGSDKAELYYILGETSAQNGDFELARNYFLTLSDEHRRSDWAPKALYARGRLFLEEEKFDESADAFELLRERYPFDAMTRRIGTSLGESYYQQRNFEEAIRAFEDALPHLDHENRQKAVYLTAESYNALNQYDDATRFYRQYINAAEEDDDLRIAHYGLGWVYHKQEIYHWAARSFGEAATGDDELARKALYYKGANEKMAGRSDQAISSFRDFGDRFQSGAFIEQAYFEWAVLAFEVGFYGEAIEALRPLAQRAEELENPGEVITFLGEVYFANGEYTRALETFEIAEDISDLDPAVKRQARFQRAWVQYSNQAYEQSQPEFERVHNESPESTLGKEALFWSADAHYQIRNYGPAASQYARFIERYPDHELVGAAKYALGWSYFMMGDFENATAPLIDFLENYDPPSIALFPFDTDTQLRIGDAFYAQGEYRDALGYYNMAIGSEPGGDYAMFQVANSYYRMNQNFEAVSQFRRVLRIYPFSTLREQAQYNVAYIYLNTGNYDQAIEEFQAVINRYPGTEWAARAQYNIGDSYYNAGNYDQAIEAYKQVLEDYPRSNYIIEAINGIQFAQLSAGEEDSSTEVLEEFLADNPTSSTADRLRFRQAENMMQSGDYEAAVNEFRQYLRITNNRELVPDAYINMADAYVRTDNTEAAIEALQTLVNDYPDSDQIASALAELGRLHYQEGNYRESYQNYEQLIEADARYRQEGILGMGNANIAMGNVNQARQNFEEVLSIDENSDAARVGLGKVLLEDDRVEEARRFFSLVAESNTTDIGAEAQYLLGESYLSSGDSESAREAFSRVQVLFETYDVWVAEAQYKIAEIHIREGRRGDAISLLESIVERYPGTSGAEKAEGLLNRN